MDYLHFQGVLEVGKNHFFNENFQFFTPTYFPIFQDGGTKNSKKGIFLMKIFNFLPQRIFRFSKMAEQKIARKGLSTLPGGFRGWKKRFF